MRFYGVAGQAGSSLRAGPGDITWMLRQMILPSGDGRPANYCLPSRDPHRECGVVTTVGSGSRKPCPRDNWIDRLAGGLDL